MSIHAMNAVIAMDDLNTTEKFVLLMLANALNQHTEKCHPPQERLAKECAVSVATVARHLRNLEKRGLIKRYTRHLGRGQGSVTRYRLLFLKSSTMKTSDMSEPERHQSSDTFGKLHLRPSTSNQCTPKRESLDLSPLTGGSKINQNIKTETSNAGAADDSLVEIELLAQSMFERIWQQIQQRGSGRAECEQAFKAMVADVRWAGPNILYLSWARPYDEARTALHRELRDSGIKLSRMSELRASSEAPEQPVRH